jgi:hypothetical protein
MCGVQIVFKGDPSTCMQDAKFYTTHVHVPAADSKSGGGRGRGRGRGRGGSSFSSGMAAFAGGRGGGGGGGAAEGGRTLSYWCFNPGVAMKQLVTGNAVRCVLLTSGTLSPMDSFAHELQLKFPVVLENPHVISPEQVWVGVIEKGPAGHKLNSTYGNRSNPKYMDDLGLSLSICQFPFHMF